MAVKSYFHTWSLGFGKPAAILDKSVHSALVKVTQLKIKSLPATTASDRPRKIQRRIWIRVHVVCLNS